MCHLAVYKITCSYSTEFISIRFIFINSNNNLTNSGINIAKQSELNSSATAMRDTAGGHTSQAANLSGGQPNAQHRCRHDRLTVRAAICNKITYSLTPKSRTTQITLKKNRNRIDAMQCVCMCVLRL